MAAQVLFFTGALGLGVAVGVLYDIFRILRVRLRLPLLGGILDSYFAYLYDKYSIDVFG